MNQIYKQNTLFLFQAAAISIEFIDEYNTDKFNPAVQDFLSKLPGITTRNIYAILNRVNSLAELLTLTIDDIEEILGSKQNATDLHESLHGKLKPMEESAEIKRPIFGSKAKTGKSGSRFKSKFAIK